MRKLTSYPLHIKTKYFQHILDESPIQVIICIVHVQFYQNSWGSRKFERMDYFMGKNNPIQDFPVFHIKSCWTLGSMLPMSFPTWVNHLLWILTPVIMAETNAYGFWFDDNRSPTNSIKVTSVMFKTHMTHAKGAIIGHWVQCFP